MTRTYFDPEETEEFEAAKDLLVRRCLAWAERHDLPADALVLATALDARHHSRDGRLGFWDEEQVRRFLLEWLPHHVVAPQERLDAAPESLRTLLRYLDATGLRDPRGAAPDRLEQVVATPDFHAALRDPARQGVGKFWAQTALDNGIDLTDSKAMNRFRRDLDAGRITYDNQALDQALEAQLLGLGPDEERAFPQPPLALPPASELAGAAAGSRIVRQLTALAGWAGGDGRVLTATGNLRVADARELAELLGTGEHELKVRGAGEMPRLSLLLAWAKRARLVRVSKGRLLAVAKAAPLLRDPARLWSRAFESFFELGESVCGPEAMLAEVFEEITADVLASVYGLPDWVPVVRLQETVWLACNEYFTITAPDLLREESDQDLVAILETLAELGAVELSHGLADELYSSDLEEEELPLPPDARSRLRARLAEPGVLVRLTPLGLRGTRERMLADGRDVPLVGELADAAPAELLGVLAEHYTREAAVAELDGWLARHGEDVEPLLAAIRACPFRNRASAMLTTLVAARPDGPDLLLGLRGDRELGPIALTALVDEGTLDPDGLAPDEQFALMTEGIVSLLELAGPDGLMDQLRQVAGRDASQVLEAVLSSGHPAEESLAELRELAARSGPLRFAGGPPPGARGRRQGGKRSKRRG